MRWRRGGQRGKGGWGGGAAWVDNSASVSEKAGEASRAAVRRGAEAGRGGARAARRRPKTCAAARPSRRRCCSSAAEAAHARGVGVVYVIISLAWCTASGGGGASGVCVCVWRDVARGVRVRWGYRVRWGRVLHDRRPRRLLVPGRPARAHAHTHRRHRARSPPMLTWMLPSPIFFTSPARVRATSTCWGVCVCEAWVCVKVVGVWGGGVGVRARACVGGGRATARAAEACTLATRLLRGVGQHQLNPIHCQLIQKVVWAQGVCVGGGGGGSG